MHGLRNTNPQDPQNTDHTAQELSELTTSPPSGISVALADEANLYEWKVAMDGPADSPYAVSSIPVRVTHLRLRYPCTVSGWHPLGGDGSINHRSTAALLPASDTDTDNGSRAGASR